MSILRFINGRNRKLSQLKGSIAYVYNPQKVKHGCRGGTGVELDSAYADMKIVKLLHGKTTGRQYIHFVISFDKVVEYITAFEVCEEVLDYFEGQFQVVFAVHENTANVHGHFILNTVGADGHKFRQSKKEMLKFRSYVNEILKLRGLNRIGEIDMKSVDDYAELATFLEEIILDEDEWNDLLHESYESDENTEENKELEIKENTAIFKEAYVPIWFGERKPYMPIHFDERHEEKTLVYEPIKFDDTHEEEQVAFQPIKFFEEAE